VTESISIPELRYGAIDAALVQRWSALEAEEDGAFFAVNLMAYRDMADYGDEVDRPTISGREADDRYAPLGPLAKAGATVVLFADVAAQQGSKPRWDRVAIVRYPSRRAFLDMQASEEFLALHLHKEAGMAKTILAACVPSSPGVSAPGVLVMRVARSDEVLPNAPGATRVVTFDVEGIVIGDGRTYDHVAIDACEDEAALAASLAADVALSDHFSIQLDAALVDTVARAVTPR